MASTKVSSSRSVRRRRAGAAGAAATVLGSAGGALLLGLTASPASAWTSFTVDTLDDGAANASDCIVPAGSCSLRDALAAAATVNDGIGITFDSNLFTGGPQTLLVDATQGPLIVDTSLYLYLGGPGPDLLTISGQGQTGVFQTASNGSFVLYGMTIANGHSSTGGGAIMAPIGRVDTYDMKFENNTSDADGGAISVDGTLNLRWSTLSGNTSVGDGGAVSVGGYLYLDNSTFSNNTAQGFGGAVNAGYSSQVERTTFSGNYAGAHGGAIAAYNVYGATLNVRTSTFSSNSAYIGGAVRITGQNSHLEMINSTITDNSAYFASAIEVGASASANIDETTITGNNNSYSSPTNGAIALDNNTSQLDVIGSIVSGNFSNGTVPADFGNLRSAPGTSISVSYSFVGVVSADLSINGSNNVTGLDPQLYALGDNGGPTKTMKPMSGSPVIDIGPTNFQSFLGSSRDQTGINSRTAGPASDAGAIEVPLPARALPVGDQLFGLKCEAPSGQIQDTLFSLDLGSGQATAIGSAFAARGGECADALTYNPVTGNVYAIDFGFWSINEVDLTTGVRTVGPQISAVRALESASSFSFAFTRNGTAVLIIDNSYYTLDILTGEATLVGFVHGAASVIDVVASLALNPVDGELYALTLNGGVYQFDDCGQLTSVGQLRSDGGFGQLEFDSSGIGWVGSSFGTDDGRRISSFELSDPISTQANSDAPMERELGLILPAVFPSPSPSATTPSRAVCYPPVGRSLASGDTMLIARTAVHGLDLVNFDPRTGEETFIASLPASVVGDPPVPWWSAWNSSDGLEYLVLRYGDGSAMLHSLDLTTGQLSGETRLSGFPSSLDYASGLAIDSTGAGFFISKNVLYSFDLSTAAATRIAPVGNPFAPNWPWLTNGPYITNFALNPADGDLYAVTQYGHFMKVDPTDGSITRLPDFAATPSLEVSSLSFDANGVGWIKVMGKYQSFDLSSLPGSLQETHADVSESYPGFLIGRQLSGSSTSTSSTVTPGSSSTSSSSTSSSTSSSSTSSSTSSTTSTSTPSSSSTSTPGSSSTSSSTSSTSTPSSSSTSSSTTSTSTPGSSSTSSSTTSTSVPGSSSTTTAPSTSLTTSTTTGAPSGTGSSSVSLKLSLAVGDSLRAGGGTVSASATGALPGSPFETVVHSVTTVIGSGVADANGAFGGTFPLPTDLEGGAHEVTLAFTHADGSPGSASAWFALSDGGVVTAVAYDGPTLDPTSALPRTGSDSKKLVEVGGAFALLGSAVVAVAARRRQDLAKRRSQN